MRVRASLLPPVAALAAFAAVQTASGSTAPPPQPQAAGIQPALAHVAAELVSASAEPAAAQPAAPGPALAPAAADLTRAAAVPPRTRERPRPHRLVVVRGTVGLRYRPGGRPRLAVGSTTEFGSRRVMPVAAERGKWLGVVTTERPNNRLAWIRRADRALTMRRTARSLHADLSARTLTLRRRGRRIHRANVAVGRPGSETPTGRFAVTDKIAGSNYGPYYGCCILALSGHQTNLPPGWTGGNRLAIHGTDAPSTIGAAASAGCLRAADADLQVLMRKVPLGTPVFIRP
jgi:lipoprotein-anchoring transpeptidase ErfK/SrfK